MELRATLGISLPAGFIRAITAALVVFVAGAVLLTSGRGGSPTATHRSRAAALPVMPWGVMKNSWSEGASYSLYVDNPTHHNGALSLNAKSGSTCQSTSGAADYKNEIIGPPNGSVVCDVSRGDVLPIKTGQNTGPTAQGIDNRITSWDPLTAIVQFTANGHLNVLKPNSPQLVLLPVVEDMSGGSTWPSGSGTVRVIGFAYFVLTQPGYTNGGKTVLGTIVGLCVTRYAARCAN